MGRRRSNALMVLAAVVGGGAPLSAQVVDTLPPNDSLLDEPTPTFLVSPDTLEAPYAGPLPPAAASALASILTASPDTPGGMGLLETGMEEARIALHHASLAGGDSTNLANMQRHMAHVLHAVDPGQGSQGPGMGYGVRRAARQILSQIQRAEMVDGVPGVLLFHAPRMAAAAMGTAARTDEVVALARQIQNASTPREGNRLVRRLDDAIRAMAYGFDADGDRRIGHSEDEMGLAQIGHHLAIVERLAR